MNSETRLVQSEKQATQVVHRDAADGDTRYPYEEPYTHNRGLFAWIKGEKVLIWTIALLLGQAIARIITALMDDIVEPSFNRAFGDPDNKSPTVSVLGAKLKLRHFIVAIIQFLIIITIAYALSGSGRHEPAYYRPINAPAQAQ